MTGAAVFRKPGTERGATVAPSARLPGRWQITMFDARGFSGDDIAADEAGALKLAASMGYTEPMPAEEFDRLALTARFQAGCELTFLINKARTLEEDVRFYELCAIVNNQPIPPDHAERVAAMRAGGD